MRTPEQLQKEREKRRRAEERLWARERQAAAKKAAQEARKAHQQAVQEQEKVIQSLWDRVDLHLEKHWHPDSTGVALHLSHPVEAGVLAELNRRLVRVGWKTQQTSAGRLWIEPLSEAERRRRTLPLPAGLPTLNPATLPRPVWWPFGKRKEPHP
jgi:hypothetical protein